MHSKPASVGELSIDDQLESMSLEGGAGGRSVVSLHGPLYLLALSCFSPKSKCLSNVSTRVAFQGICCMRLSYDPIYESGFIGIALVLLMIALLVPDHTDGFVERRWTC